MNKATNSRFTWAVVVKHAAQLLSQQFIHHARINRLAAQQQGFLWQHLGAMQLEQGFKVARGKFSVGYRQLAHKVSHRLVI